MVFNSCLVFLLVSAVVFNDAAVIITLDSTSLVDGTIKACAGSDVYLNWNFTINDTAEHEYNIDWILTLSNLTELYIASSSHGHLFDGNGKYEKTTNAGIKIVNVTKADEGNYSVTVVTMTGRNFHSYTVNQNVSLQVDEPAVISNGNLTIEYSPGENNDILLKCGHFTSLGNPNVTVVWMYNSTKRNASYEDGYFTLSQPLADVGYVFECSVTPAPQSACPAHYTFETKQLNSNEVRLSLIEARLAVLEKFHNIGTAVAVGCGSSACSQSDVADVAAQLVVVKTENDFLERSVQSLNKTLHDLSHNLTGLH